MAIELGGCGCCEPPCEGPITGQNVFQITKEEYDSYLRGGTWSLNSTWSQYEAQTYYDLYQTSYGSGSVTGTATTQGCSGGVFATGTANVTYTMDGEIVAFFDYEIMSSVSYSLGRDLENNLYFVKLSGEAHVASSNLEYSPCGYPSVSMVVNGNNLIAFGDWCPGWQGDGYTNTSYSTLTATYTPNL